MALTKAELEALAEQEAGTRAELEQRVEDLDRENAELRAELAERAGLTGGGVTTGVRRPAPRDPSFGLSEGERADLEQSGVAVSPFTGAVRKGTPEDYTTTERSGRGESSADEGPAAEQPSPEVGDE